MLHLNKNQKDAVENVHGATLVIAGAGSGKTRVITTRIVHLITRCNASASSIVAVTFTNKAAREMRNRVVSLLDANAPLPFVGTFHSYCVRLLRSNPKIFGSDNFSIIDSDDQAELIRRLIKQHGLEKRWTPSKILHYISGLKIQLNWKEASKNVPGEIKELYQLYEQEKAESHSLDFDDLLLTVYSTLRDNAEFATKLRSNIKHILVDEYQDTNELQHELLKKLALNSKKQLDIASICAVGDEDQSIYSWRGAIVENIAKFQKDFTPVKLIKIEQNYRSAQPILKAANSVIANNLNRTPKNLWSEKKASDRILTIACKNEYQEADVMAAFAKNLPKDTKRSNLAVLYRTHAQSRVLEEAFLNNGIPYTIVGGIRFYERREIKDLLAYLRLIENPFDRISFLRVLNRPTRGLGKKCEQVILDTWKNAPTDNFQQLLNNFIGKKDSVITGKRAQSLQTLFELLSKLVNEKKSPTTTLKNIIELTGYCDYLRSSFDDEESRSRLTNVDEFIRCTQKFEERCLSGKVKMDGITINEPITPTLRDFLNEIALIQEETTQQGKDISDTVQLMTLHSAKGLEFNTVLLPGNEEGTLPSAQSIQEPRQLEEERRLFYVGLTRAKERLVLTTALTRAKFGRIETMNPSRFIGELPQKIVKTFDSTKIPLPILNHSIKCWFTGKAFFAAQRAKLPITCSINRSKTTYKPIIKRQTKQQRALQHKTSSKKTVGTSSWSKNRMVRHTKFGHGLVTGVKKMQNGEFCLIVSFKTETKKILSKFLELI